MSYTDRLTDNKAQDFASKVGEIFKSLPHLPKGLVEFFVKIAPYLVLLGAILSLFASPVLGLLSVFSLFTFNPVLVLSVTAGAVLSLLSAVVMFMAFRPLKERKYRGWMLLFWGNMLSFAGTLLHLVLGQEGLGSLVGTAISFYVLYEMRPWYGVKGKVEAVKAKLKR